VDKHAGQTWPIAYAFWFEFTVNWRCVEIVTFCYWSSLSCMLFLKVLFEYCSCFYCTQGCVPTCRPLESVQKWCLWLMTLVSKRSASSILSHLVEPMFTKFSSCKPLFKGSEWYNTLTIWGNTSIWYTLKS